MQLDRLFNILTGVHSINRLFVLFATLSSILCCAPEDESGKCKDPGPCDNCFKIYDSEDNYINSGSISSGSTHAQWNGLDCNGDSVDCGKYRIEYSYQGRYISNDLIVSGPGAVSKHTRSECDSLKKACNGFFYEEETITGISCICCQ